MKRGLALIIGLLILSSVIIFAVVSTNTATQPASSVLIKVDGTERTLQYAVDNGLLKGTHTYASASAFTVGQHDESQIWVSVKDGEMNLSAALQSTNKLCPLSTKPLTYSKIAPNPGHYGTEIILSSGTSLQQLINDGSLCTAYSWYTSSWSSNGVCPTTTFTRTVYCKRDDGTNMGTTCGTYAGCGCSTPSSSTTTTCTWVQGSATCGCGSIPGMGGIPICSGIDACSKWVGTSCSSSGSVGYCVEGSCSCGKTCSASQLYRPTCTINSP